MLKPLTSADHGLLPRVRKRSSSSGTGVPSLSRRKEVPPKPSGHAFLDARRDDRDLLARGRTTLLEDDLLGLRVAHEDTVEHDDVQVHEGAEGRVEPLHEGDAARLASIALLPPRDLLDEDAVLG